MPWPPGQVNPIPHPSDTLSTKHPPPTGQKSACGPPLPRIISGTAVSVEWLVLGYLNYPHDPHNPQPTTHDPQPTTHNTQFVAISRQSILRGISGIPAGIAPIAGLSVFSAACWPLTTNQEHGVHTSMTPINAIYRSGVKYLSVIE